MKKEEEREEEEEKEEEGGAKGEVGGETYCHQERKATGYHWDEKK